MKNFHSMHLRRAAFLLFLLGCFTNCFAALSASATLTWTQVGSQFNYTIVVKNTGTTNIGTFWFSWLPGADYLPTRPSAAAGPAGWSASILQGVPGFSIEYVATSGPIGPGQTSNAFTFSTTDTPAVILGTSSPSGNKVTTTTIYSGGPFSDTGFVLVVTQGTTSSNAFKLAKDTIVGGNAVAGTVTLAQPSSSATVVSITSDNAAVTVPGGGVTVPAGKTTVPVSFSTKGVAVATSVKLSAKFGATSIDAQLAVNPATLVGFTLSNAVVAGGKPTAIAVFDGLTGSVRSLTVTAAGSAAVVIGSPTSVPSQTKSQPITLGTNGVDLTTNATVTVHDGGVALSKPLQIRAASVSKISLAGALVGGNRPGFTVTLNGLAGPSGKSFQLVSDHATLLNFPAGKVAAQQSSVKLAPALSLGVAANTDVALSVGTVKTTVTLLPASLKSVVPAAASVIGGADLKVVVQLTGKWGPVAGSLAANSNSLSLTIPSTASIVPQTIVTTLVCHTKAVTKDTTVTLSVTVNGVTKTASVVVKAPAPARP